MQISKFAVNNEIHEKLKFLRHEDGMDVYLASSSEEELYVSRTQDLQ